MSTLKVNTVQHNTSGFNNVVQFTDGGGTQNGTLCRAWVNFNGTGTVAIRASFNVSSITDHNTGEYSVNLSNSLSDTNYCTVVSNSNAPGTQDIKGVIYTNNTNTPAAPTTSAFRVQFTANTGEAKTDVTFVCCSVFR